MRGLTAILAAAALALTGCDDGPVPSPPTPGGPGSVELVSLKVTDIVTHVDADAPEEIEADLAADVLMVEGGGFSLGHGGPVSDSEYLYECTFVDADGAVAAEGTLSMRKGEADWSTAYSFLPIDSQIYVSQKWTIERQGKGGHRIDVYVVAYTGRPTRVSVSPPHRYRLYEDMTEYYRAKFPDAGVRSVARVFISPGSGSLGK